MPEKNFHTVEIINDCKIPESLPELIRTAAAATLQYENVRIPCEISVTLTDNAQIRELNRQFRAVDKPTDVLSFPSGEYPTEENACFLGDIAISLEKAVEQCREYGHTLEREVAFLTAHSVLHLLGYDHMDAQEEKIMFGKQEQILNTIGQTRE